MKDAGYIDVKDRTTFEIAKAYLKLFAEKLGIAEEAGRGEWLDLCDQLWGLQLRALHYGLAEDCAGRQ